MDQLVTLTAPGKRRLMEATLQELVAFENRELEFKASERRRRAEILRLATLKVKSTEAKL